MNFGKKNKTEQTETNENKDDQTETNSLIENKKQKTKKENKKQNESTCAAFDVFWAAYPRHTNKQAALKAWIALNPDEELQKTILAAIERQKKSAQWARDGGQYIPHPATWLHGQRWEDELPRGNAGKTVGAQAYTQRDYTEEELLAVSDDLIAEAKREKEYQASVVVEPEEDTMARFITEAKALRGTG